MMVVPTVVPLVFEKMAPVGVHVLPIVGDVPPASHVGIDVAVENREYPYTVLPFFNASPSTYMPTESSPEELPSVVLLIMSTMVL
jgi:hypothetical protein